LESIRVGQFDDEAAASQPLDQIGFLCKISDPNAFSIDVVLSSSSGGPASLPVQNAAGGSDRRCA